MEHGEELEQFAPKAKQRLERMKFVYILRVSLTIVTTAAVGYFCYQYYFTGEIPLEIVMLSLGALLMLHMALSVFSDRTLHAMAGVQLRMGHLKYDIYFGVRDGIARIVEEMFPQFKKLEPRIHVAEEMSRNVAAMSQRRAKFMVEMAKRAEQMPEIIACDQLVAETFQHLGMEPTIKDLKRFYELYNNDDRVIEIKRREKPSTS